MWPREIRYVTNILCHHNVFFLGVAIFLIMRTLYVKFPLCLNMQ